MSTEFFNSKGLIPIAAYYYSMEDFKFCNIFYPNDVRNFDYMDFCSKFDKSMNLGWDILKLGVSANNL